MIKLILLILLIVLGGPTRISAQDQCAVALSHSSDTRIGKLSNEGQDIILMASLIASQTQTTADSTIQINPALMFLGAITEVKVDSQEKGVFHNFSFIDGMLFTVLKRLGILEDTQAYLLNLLGFSNNNLGPFEIRPDGGVTLRLNTTPTISIATHFEYDETAGLILDAIGRSTLQTPENSNQNLPNFSERLFLNVLAADIPLREFLFKVLNKEDATGVTSLLYPLFSEIRPTIEPSEGLFERLILEKGEIIRRAIQWIQQGVSSQETASRLGINHVDLQRWLDEYQKKHGTILRR